MIGRTAIAIATIVGLTLAIAPSARAEEPPNIIVVLTDDQATDTTGLMPFVASQEWTSFDAAYDNNALCCPSRATILSGLYSHHTGVENNDLANRFDPTNTIATNLHDAGYTTGLFGKYLNEFPWGRGPGAPPGWDRWAAFKGLPGYYDYTLDLDGTYQSFGHEPSDYSTDEVGERAVDFVNSAQEPFFAYYAPYGPHQPYTPAPGDEHAYDDLHIFLGPSWNEPARNAPDWWRRREPVTRDETREVVRSQAETTLSEDRQTEALFGALEQRGALDNTAVLFMSDNGYSTGEHRWIGKRCPYEACGLVPILLRLPGGGVDDVTTPVTNVDVAETLRQIAGVPHQPTDGQSLLPLATGQESGDAERAILIRNRRDRPGTGHKGENIPSYWGLRTERWKYVEYTTGARGERELYDLHADPQETNNLAGLSAKKRRQRGYATVMRKLDEQLEQMRAQAPEKWAGKIGS